MWSTCARLHVCLKPTSPNQIACVFATLQLPLFFALSACVNYNKPLSKRVPSAVILVELHLEKIRRTWSTERSSPSRYSRVEPTESESLWDRKNANSRSGVRRAGPSASAPTALRGCVKIKRTAWPASHPRKTLFPGSQTMPKGVLPNTFFTMSSYSSKVRVLVADGSSSLRAEIKKDRFR